MAFGKKKTSERNYEKIEDPLQILKLKFANGDIDRREFEEKYMLLSEI